MKKVNTTPDFIDKFIEKFPTRPQRVEYLKEFRRDLPDNNDPVISIVTPSFNQGKFIERTILSILLQPYKNIDYIIYDAKSTDESLQIIKDYGELLAFWRSEADNGQSHAINKGVKQAKGEIFNWINSDDFLTEDALLGVVESYRKNKKAVAWVGAVRRVDKDYTEINVVYPNNLNLYNIGQNYNGRQVYQPGCFYNLSALKYCGGINENYYFAMDFELYLRMLRHGDFSIGRGIWAAALIHSDAKTQNQRQKMFVETSSVQEQYGFKEGAINRIQRVSGKRPLKVFFDTNTHTRVRLLNKNNSAKRFNWLRKKKLIIVSNYLPRFNSTASNLRVAEIIKILLENKFEITYLYNYRTDDDELYKNQFNGNITFYKHKPDVDTTVKLIKESAASSVWLTNFWTVERTQFIDELTKHLKTHAPKIGIFADTMDFHYKKYMLRHKESNDQEDQDIAKQFLELERSIYTRADSVIVVSEDEKEDISEAFPELNNLSVVPLVQEITPSSPTFKKTAHICFVGNFSVAHNVDAADYFMSNIFNRIRVVEPDVEFHIIGHGSEKMKKWMKYPGVKIIGSVDSVEKTLLQYRVLVCPMMYGAGMKGKIAAATSVGLPVVTTSVGAEGFGFEEGKDVFIADNPEEFAGKCIQLLQDPVCWSNFSVNAKIAISEISSRLSVSKRLASIMRTKKSDT